MRSTVRWQWRIILSLALALTALSLPGRAQSPLALVHVRIDSISDLTRVDASGMPILAHLTGSNGDYLLARLSPDAQRQLASMGFAVSVLDANATGATYYLLESPRLGAVSDTPLTIIWDDGRYAVGRLRQGVSAQSVDDIDTPKMELGPDPIVLLARASAAIPTTVTYDPLVARLLAQVTSDSVYAYAGGLSGAWPVSIGGAPYTLTTRYTYSGTPIAKATQYVYEHLQARGYTTSYHYYTLSGNTLRNVIGEKTGQTHPDQIVLLTAHLDSRAASAPHDPAPGADDNASGATALLIAADLLADLEFEYTVRVVFFTGEEQGMLGSYDYAAAVYSAGDDILGVINLDMIAWDAKYGPDIDLHSNTPSIFNDSDRLAQVFVSSIGVYGLNLTPQIVDNGARFSDHSRFWDRGYPAIMAIEDYYNASEVAAEPRDWNTNYHTDKDTVGTLNLTYFREYARAGLATFAHLARPMRTISGAITSSVGEVVDGATVVAAGTTGTFQTMTDSAGRYALQVPAGTYSISASAPNYLSQTVTGVVVETGEGTRRDFVLGQVQRFTVHGAVSDAQSGVGLAAVLQFGAGPTVSTTNGEYNVELVSGTHPVTLTAPYHHPVVDSVVVDQDQRRDFALEPTACILVVDDDFDNLGNRFDDQVFYTSTLDALRVGHDVWTVPDDANGPPFDVLTLYRGVIWLTGRDWDATITSVDQAALGAYLDGGGNLFLSGQDVGYDIGRSSSPAPFYSSYLRAAYGLDDSGSRTLAGEGILAGINVMIE
ncbi:MAG: M20/M25/M40 family metallo-hydrolase, partial [Chloroflexi bacterium]|nr:M20/M25/M40 family metallo-hydrolase [Chloroflexota bacterium]